MKALRTKGLFLLPITVQKEGRLRVDINAGLKLLGSVHLFKPDAFVADIAPDPRVVFEEEDAFFGFSIFIISEDILSRREKGHRAVPALT